jgi:hypothetical protein
LNEVGRAAARTLTQFKLQELSITLWAFSRLGESHDELFAATADLISESSDAFKWYPQAMSNLLWAFAKQVDSGSAASHSLVRASETIVLVCERLLPELKTQEWCSILWAISHLTNDSDVAWQQLELLGRNGPAVWHDHSMSNCISCLAALASLAYTSVEMPQSFSGMWQSVVCMCNQRQSEIEPSMAIQLLELSVLPDGPPLLMDLQITAASIVLRDIQSIQPAGLMRLVNCKLQLPEESLNSLVGALTHRILCLGFKAFQPGDKEKIMEFCARYARNVQAQVGLASLESIQSEACFEAVQNTSDALLSDLSNSPWSWHAVQNIGVASPNDLSSSCGSNNFRQLSALQFQGAYFPAEWPEAEYYHSTAVTPTSLLPPAMCYFVGKPLQVDGDHEECSSVATSAGDSGNLNTSCTGSEPETMYEVKNTFVHIPTCKRGVRTSRARSLDVERVC